MITLCIIFIKFYITLSYCIFPGSVVCFIINIVMLSNNKQIQSIHEIFPWPFFKDLFSSHQILFSERYIECWNFSIVSKNNYDGVKLKNEMLLYWKPVFQIVIRQKHILFSYMQQQFLYCVALRYWVTIMPDSTQLLGLPRQAVYRLMSIMLLQIWSISCSYPERCQLQNRFNVPFVPRRHLNSFCSQK